MLRGGGRRAQSKFWFWLSSVLSENAGRLSKLLGGSTRSKDAEHGE